jgi:hypothetical protein
VAGVLRDGLHRVIGGVADYAAAAAVAVLMGLATALMPRPPHQPDSVTAITPDAAEA